VSHLTIYWHKLENHIIEDGHVSNKPFLTKAVWEAFCETSHVNTDRPINTMQITLQIINYQS